MKCSICGSEIDVTNLNRCSRFPICPGYINMENKTINDLTDYVIFDLETTGLNKKNDRIIEIGGIKVKDGQVVDRFNELCAPIKDGELMYVSAKITEITGIKNADLADKQPETEVVAKFMEWLGDANQIAIAHNGLNFDTPFLKEACKRAGVDFKFGYILDTMLLSKALNYVNNGVLPNNKQETLAKHFGITYQAHRAVNDCEALLKIFNCLKEDAKNINYSLKKI